MTANDHSPKTENAQPEWLTRTCPVCGSRPGWGCSNAVGNCREKPHADRVIPPAGSEDGRG